MNKVAKVLLGHSTIEKANNGHFLVCESKDGKTSRRIPIIGNRAVAAFDTQDMFGEQTAVKIELSRVEDEYI